MRDEGRRSSPGPHPRGLDLGKDWDTTTRPNNESLTASNKKYYNESGALVSAMGTRPVAESTPGPGAYSPTHNLIHTAVENNVFGLAKQRERAGLTYISALHSADTPSTLTPGPGTYRLPSPDKVAHMTTGASYKFGSANQRGESLGPRSDSPGPKYDGNSEPVTAAPRYSFAPQNSIELGASRHRDDCAKVLISEAHSVLDRSALNADMPGPAAYDMPNPEVSKARAPNMHFGTGQRMAKDSMGAMQLASDPLSGTSATTPGPHYDLRSLAEKRGAKFTMSQRTFYPERGNTMAGPFISKLHAEVQQGADSPGPALYDATSYTGEHTAVGFPGAATGRATAQPAAVVPGPGAYRPLLEHSSKVQAMPSFSMGYSMPRQWGGGGAGPNGPGPATYDIFHTTTLESRRTLAPAFSLASRDPHRDTRSAPSSPGPNMYMLPGTLDVGPRRGYTFGGREKLHSNSVTSIRYHGALSMTDAMGSDSPGPIYDVSRSLSAGGSYGSTFKFGTSLRELSRKTRSDDATSPGPGSYNVAALNLSTVTSRFKSEPGGKFSKVDRFNNPAQSK